MSDALSGRTVLVTGAASGLGFAYAEACAAAGARLVLLDRDAANLESAASELRAGGTRVMTFVVDLAEEAQVDEVFDQVLAENTPDAAFLNAGINGGSGVRMPDGEVDALPREVWHRVLDVNLTGFFYSLQHVAAAMKKAGRGAIIVTGSTSGVRAEPFVSYAYTASKAAVHAVAQQAALELSKYGVRINVIAPGPFNTNIGGRNPRPDDKTKLWERTIPMKRWGDPRELAGLSVLLASDASSFMTGSIVRIDGGASTLTQIPADEL